MPKHDDKQPIHDEETEDEVDELEDEDFEDDDFGDDDLDDSEAAEAERELLASFFGEAEDESWIIYDPASPQATRALLKEIGAAPNKTLGQNFLISGDVLDRIVATANLQPDDIALEIGPGLGSLTCRLVRAAGQVTAIEKDPALVGLLQRHFRPRNFSLICDDALDVAWDALELPATGVKVVANLPYGISKPMLRRLLEEWRPHFVSLTLLVQREVADRIVAAAATSEYGPLAIMTQLHAQAKRVFDVKAGSFLPPPNVTSSVVHIVLRDTPSIALRDEKFFWRVVRAAFAQRRKQLANTLRAITGDSANLAAAFEQSKIDPKRRGETLTLQEFADLTHALQDALAV